MLNEEQSWRKSEEAPIWERDVEWDTPGMCFQEKKEKENSWPSHRMIIPSSDAWHVELTVIRILIKGKL